MTPSQESQTEPIIASLFIEALHKGQPLWFRVGSGSMLPLLKVDTQVYIEPVMAREIRVGEIAAFETPKGLVIHRIVHRQVDEGVLRLLQMPDTVVHPTWVNEQAVVGRVVAIRSGNRQMDLKHGRIAQMYGRVTAFLRYRLYMTENRLLHTFLRICSRLALLSGCWCIERCSTPPVELASIK